MVASHLQATQVLASGIHAVPDANLAFAATIGAHRFLNNPRVSLPALAEPLLEVARREAIDACDRYGLVIHDWSQLKYPAHASKRDRLALSGTRRPNGYELQTALLVSDRDGCPLAPLVMSLRAANGVHCSRSMRVRRAISPLDELAPAMDYIERQKLSRPLVHIIDAEADSVGHYREWIKQPNRRFLVRIDDRIARWNGREQHVSAIRRKLRGRAAFRHARRVLYHGRPAQQWIAEASIQLTRPAQRNRPSEGDRRRIAGPPVALRLIISEVRNAAGRVLAIWYLVSNVPADVNAATIALWYYWRWSIETYFKLMKSAGMNVEHWQQDHAAAIARRLLVASMACVTVWRLARSTHPRAEQARELLVRLSGRQMKHGTKFTLPALLAGLWTLLTMLEVLKTHSLAEIKTLAKLCLPPCLPP